MVASHDLYQRERQALVERLQALSDAQASTSVPSCPGWTVKDVVAHLSGLVAETLVGVPLPRGSDEATARQVKDRNTMTLEAICQEWLGNAAAFEEFAHQNPDYVAALASDLVVHGHDIAETLDLQIDRASAAVAWVATRYLGVLQARAAERLGIRVDVTLVDVDSQRREPVASEGTLTLATTAYTFLRSVTGRRSRRHVEMLDWSQDPTALLDGAWNQYGPMSN